MNDRPITQAHLSHVGLRAPETEPLQRFYEEVVGMTLHEQLEGRRRLGWGVGHHALEILPGEAGLDHFALELPGPERLDDLANRLGDMGVPVTEGRPVGDHPATFEIEDPDGNRVELHGPINRSGEHAADPGRRPVRIHHVTLATRSMARMVDFYVEALGFRVSDRMGGVFTWLRCNKEHHTVAIVESDDLRGLDHYAFELHGWEDFKTWCDELAARDVSVRWGPGRHGPGNNLFIMFDDSAGFHVELSSELERYWDDRAEYTPRRWEVSPRTVNLWGGPGADWREAPDGRNEETEVQAPRENGARRDQTAFAGGSE
jgi:catechol-2,3-dioxygenase